MIHNGIVLLDIDLKGLIDMRKHLIMFVLLFIFIKSFVLASEFPAFNELIFNNKTHIIKIFKADISKVRIEKLSTSIRESFNGIERKLNKATIESIDGEIDYYKLFIKNYISLKTNYPTLRQMFINDTVLCDLLIYGCNDFDHHNSSKFLKIIKPINLRGKLNYLTNYLDKKKGIPGLDFVKLLAMTDSVEALNKIQKIDIVLSNLRNASYEIDDSIYARLGNIELEYKLISQFKSTKDENKKFDLVGDIAFINTPKAAIALASELRNPLVPGLTLEQVESLDFNNNPNKSKYNYVSLRKQIVLGLARIFPNEKIFCKDIYSIIREKPGSVKGDEYMVKVENWCTQNIGVTWEVERPKFFFSLSYRRWNP